MTTSPSPSKPSCACRYPLSISSVPSDAQMSLAYQASVDATLELLAQIPGRPKAMDPFDSLFRDPWRVEQIATKERPVVGTFCNFVPEELILAAGAIPLRLDFGQSEAAQAGERALPVDICSAVKCIMGGQIGALPTYRHADLLLIPTACDGKKKLVRALGDQREAWMVELPQTRDGPRAIQRWREEIKDLAARLGRFTGHKIRRRGLREAIRLLNRRTEIFRQLNDLRQDRPTALSGRDAFLVMHASFIADPAWWIDQTAALIEELSQAERTELSQAERDREQPQEQPLRVLLTGSPVLFPDYRLLEIVERADAVIVADEMCSGTQRLYHPTGMDETSVGGMLRAVADKTLLPCTCPCFESSDDRIDWLLHVARASRAQGVIHHTLRLCQIYDLEQQRVSAAFKELGIPFINIYTEHGTKDSAVIQNRIEAFLEMLQQY